MSLKFLSSGNALKEFRKEQYEKQGGVCPILKQKIELQDCVLDHMHSTSKDVLGENGAGLVRGVIHNGANAAEGTIASIYKRRGLHKLISLPEYLRNLADYIENPPLLYLNIVHPTEKPKRETFGKREFNRVMKYWTQTYPKRKCPVWKDNGRKKITGRMNMTKNWKLWIEKANKIHYEKYS